MKITVFTNNQPRHLSLVETLAQVADDIHVIHECNTLFTGVVADFIRKSDVMERYWENVTSAETAVFGQPRFLTEKTMPVLYGDVSHMTPEMLGDAADADIFVVFGASYIKGPMCDFLISRKAINIHMGIAPAYRGHSCNFWALYDGRPGFVGATVHRLSAGLDKGGVLFHCFPGQAPAAGFELGMAAVRAAHRGVAQSIADGGLMEIEPIPQDMTTQLRYSKGAEFTDDIADEFLARPHDQAAVQAALDARDLSDFRLPFVDG